jgi:DDE superfamily endonuclease
VQHGEGRSVDINDPDTIQQMADPRTICSKYKDKDIFNMDETGLFWKLIPERLLATETGNSGKKSKDRITLTLTTNTDGSEKLEPWVIGKSKNPRYFKGINRQCLRIQY